MGACWECSIEDDDVDELKRETRAAATQEEEATASEVAEPSKAGKRKRVASGKAAFAESDVSGPPSPEGQA